MPADWLPPTESPLTRALIVLAISGAAALLANSILFRALLRLAGRTKSDLDNGLVRIVRLPTSMTILLVGLNMSLVTVGAGGLGVSITASLTKTVVVVLWGIAAARATRLVLRELTGRRTTSRVVQPRTLPLFENVAYILIFGGGLYLILLGWHVNVTAWVASAGVAGIAVGFAAKDTLANLFAGIFIIADAPYKLGDFVMLDSGERGEVTEIGLRSTRILTRDDIEVIIPNAVIANAKIANETGGPSSKERIRIAVSAAYGSDIDQVRGILLDAARAEEHVSAAPEPRIRFRSFGDSGLRFELLAWIEEPIARGRVIDSLNSAVYRRFQENGIEIPYPKRDVYVRAFPGTAGTERPGAGERETGKDRNVP